VALTPSFSGLVIDAVAADIDRREDLQTLNHEAMFAEMLRRLETDPLWAREYEEFVQQVSFARSGERIDFSDGLAACARLVKRGLRE
jgi:hypothetical protein